jgi:hypothetical protein
MDPGKHIMVIRACASKEKMNTQQTVREAYVSGVDIALRTTVLATISEYLLETHNVTVTVDELAKCLDLPATKPRSPYDSFQPFQPTYPSNPLAPTKQPRAKPAVVDVDLTDPDFDDKFQEDRCLYVSLRGRNRHRYCGGERTPGKVTCNTCCKYKAAISLNERAAAEGDNFDPHAIRAENTAKRLNSARKRPAATKKTNGSPDIGAHPFVTKPPARDGQKSNSEYKASSYTGCESVTPLGWIPGLGYVVNMNTTEILGIASNPTEMYRHLSIHEKTQAKSNKFKIADDSKPEHTPSGTIDFFAAKPPAPAPVTNAPSLFTAKPPAPAPAPAPAQSSPFSPVVQAEDKAESTPVTNAPSLFSTKPRAEDETAADASTPVRKSLFSSGPMNGNRATIAPVPPSIPKYAAVPVPNISQVTTDEQ